MAGNVKPGIDEHGLHAKLFQLVRGGSKRGGMAPLDSVQHAHRTILEADEIETAVSGRAKDGVGAFQSVARSLKISSRKAGTVRADGQHNGLALECQPQNFFQPLAKTAL